MNFDSWVLIVIVEFVFLCAVLYAKSWRAVTIVCAILLITLIVGSTSLILDVLK
jgi:hypothetical protein